MHEGHRERMYLRLESDERLQDHELLEILLFYGLRRVNTNETAHALLDAFGSLQGVFDANTAKLKEVPGIKDETARFIHVVGKIMRRMKSIHAESLPTVSNFDALTSYFVTRHRNDTEEMLEVYTITKDGELSFCKQFTSDDEYKVDVGAEDIVSILSEFGPKEIIVVHSHVHGDCEPSREDDAFTSKLYLCLDLCKIKLRDHFIVSGTRVYSYEQAGKMDDIRKTYSAANVMKKL